MFEFNPDIATPPICNGCGIQCELGAKLLRLLFMKHMGEHAGESLVGESGEAFDAMVDETFPPEVAEDVKHTIRKGVGDDLASLDERIETTQQAIEANALSCNGILRMRAAKGDVTYTVNVCTSQRVYNRDGTAPEHIPVHIQVESINKND